MVLFNSRCLGSSDIMENDIISLFLNRKKQNICRYTEIFAQYTLNNNKLNKIINEIVEIYINKFYLEKNLDFSLLTKYFEITKTNESVMKDVLMSAIMFYKENGLEEQIEKDIKTIVILSNLIFLSVNLDDYVNEYKHGEEEIDSRIKLFLESYQAKIKVPDELLDLLMSELLSLVKKDTSAEKRFWKCLVNNNYLLHINQSLKNNHLFKIDYEYDIKMLNRYDQSEIEKTCLTKSIMDDILSIYLEKLSVIILKNLLMRNTDDNFIISINSDYFNKNKNLINIERILSNDSIKKRIVFGFSADSIKSSMSAIKYLNSKGFKLGLMDITEQFNISTMTFDIFDYVFIDSDILKKYEEYEEVWNIKEINFIIDNNEFKVISEDNLLTETR